jgi:molecular chaperone IbpA
MRTYDITPLWRSTIGFDRFFDSVDAARHTAGDDNYPPCNVERLSDERYRISLALAGFCPYEIAITAEQDVFTVEGRRTDRGQQEFLYRGISSRPFKRQFNLVLLSQKVAGSEVENQLFEKIHV